MPALFHGSLLSAAAPSRRSINVIDQSGSSRRSSAPSVALMMPAPTSTTSVFVVLAPLGSDTCSLILRGRTSADHGLPGSGYPAALQRRSRLSAHCRRPSAPHCAVKVAVVTPMGARRAARLLAAAPFRSAPTPTARASSSRRWCGAATAAPAASRAVLALHGFTDYFFNTELADHFAARGFAFYALDLRKCGRSRRDGPDAALHHRPGPLRHRTRPGAGAHRRRDRRRAGAACTGTPRAG